MVGQPGFRMLVFDGGGTIDRLSFGLGVKGIFSCRSRSNFGDAGEVVQGDEKVVLNIGIGWRGLNEEMKRFKDNLEFTKLKMNREGVDPDDVYSQVPYQKGSQFLWRIER